MYRNENSTFDFCPWFIVIDILFYFWKWPLYLIWLWRTSKFGFISANTDSLDLLFWIVDLIHIEFPAIYIDFVVDIEKQVRLSQFYNDPLFLVKWWKMSFASPQEFYILLVCRHCFKIYQYLLWHERILFTFFSSSRLRVLIQYFHENPCPNSLTVMCPENRRKNYWNESALLCLC